MTDPASDSVIKDKVYLPDIRHKFNSDNYYKACKSIINTVNAHYGWPAEYLMIKELEPRHDEIVQLILDTYTIRNNDQLASRMGHIYGALKVAGYEGSFRNKGMGLKQVPVIPKPIKKDIPSWEDMLHTLDTEIHQASHTGAVVICITYKHGYLMRCGEIANTCTKDIKGYNYLDLTNGIWYIRAEQTKNKRARDFKVSTEYIAEISPYIKKSGFMISKKSGQPYKGNFTLSTVGIKLFTVNDIRNSYETMNYNRTDIDEQGKNFISESVLGHCPSVARAYYTPAIDAKDKMKSI